MIHQELIFRRDGEDRLFLGLCRGTVRYMARPVGDLEWSAVQQTTDVIWGYWVQRAWLVRMVEESLR